MKLSRTVAYGLEAALQLARSQPGQPVPCSRLAAEGRMPERFLLQILRSLVTHGILQSTRGVDGGYALERPAEEISLLEIIEAIEGPLAAEFPANAVPGKHEFRLRDALANVAEQNRRQLEQVKLAHLIEPPRKTRAD